MTVHELSPASRYCQRWRERKQSWRDAHEDQARFDPSRYHTESIEEGAAKDYVLANHYSGSFPAARLRYGLFQRLWLPRVGKVDRLVGVCVLSVPVQASVLTNVYPQLDPYTESLELGRLVLDDPVPANAESWFLGQMFRRAALAGVRGLVSFSDPVARTAPDGTTLFKGHIGTTYQASNAHYLGRGTPRTLLLLPDGTTLNARSLSKVRDNDRGHDHVERQLRRFGARPRRAGESGPAWLAHALDEAGVRRLRHSGNHRYAFPIGTKADRRALAGDLTRLPYPKAA